MEQAQTNRRAKQHLYEVDLMRAFIILGVVCVHVISFFNLFTTPASHVKVGFDVALVALHFTREAFMFITGLVLFIVYYNKSFTALDFWSKRFKLIIIPYLVWSFVYLLFSGTYIPSFQWEPWHVLSSYLISIVTGNQFYLYYLVISMQLYILFPWFIKMMRKLEKYHGWIFVASFVLEIVFMWINQHYLETMNLTHLPQWLATLIFYRDRNILTYQFWFVSGSIVAAHYQQIKAFFTSRPRLVFGSLAAMLAILWAHQAIDRIVFHADESMLVLVLQPIMIPYSLIVSLSLWQLGIKWADARLKPQVQWFSNFVKVAAAASFGVFLVHPIVLHFMEVTVYSLHTNATERLILLPIAIIFVYGMSIVVARIIAHIPYLSYIVGQKTEKTGWVVSRTHVTETR